MNIHGWCALRIYLGLYDDCCIIMYVSYGSEHVRILSKGDLHKYYRAFMATALLVPLPLVVGGLSAAISNSGGGSMQNTYRNYRCNVRFAPPPSIFGPVWTLLYVLMGVAVMLVVRAFQQHSGNHSPLVQNQLFVFAIGLFAVQLMLNFWWSIIFFRFQQPTGALVVLLLLDIAVVATTILFARLQTVAGLLMIPYVGWILFATYLNAAIVRKLHSSTRREQNCHDV